MTAYHALPSLELVFQSGKRSWWQIYSQRLHMVIVDCFRVHTYIIHMMVSKLKWQLSACEVRNSFWKIYLRQQDLVKEQGRTLQCIWQRTCHVHHDTPHQVLPANHHFQLSQIRLFNILPSSQKKQAFRFDTQVKLSELRTNFIKKSINIMTSKVWYKL